VSDEDDTEADAKLPFRRFVIQEIRKALVPIIVAILAGGAAGSGISAYNEDERIRNAREAAEQEILRLEEIRNKLREEVQGYLREGRQRQDRGEGHGGLPEGLC